MQNNISVKSKTLLKHSDKLCNWFSTLSQETIGDVLYFRKGRDYCFCLCLSQVFSHIGISESIYNQRTESFHSLRNTAWKWGCSSLIKYLPIVVFEMLNNIITGWVSYKLARLTNHWRCVKLILLYRWDQTISSSLSLLSSWSSLVNQCMKIFQS